MIRIVTGLLLGFLVFLPSLRAREDMQRGKFKKVDADKGLLTITVNDKDTDSTTKPWFLK